MAKKYTVTDGKIVLFLEECEEGGYAVTSPIDPGVTTQADTVSEAFVMARDAMKALKAGRAKLTRELRAGKFVAKRAS